MEFLDEVEELRPKLRLKVEQCERLNEGMEGDRDLGIRVICLNQLGLH